MVIGSIRYTYHYINFFLLYLCSHKVYMKIQEQMVKLLNEDSWDDVVRNYPDSSSTSTLKAFYLAFKKVT